MTKKKKIILGVCAAVAVAVQFVRPEKNLTQGPPGKDDLFVQHPAPPEVQRLIHVACYDCHSNNTRYPWYAEIQPAGWWLAQHVNDGKSDLNLSEFGAYSPKRRGSKLDAMLEQIEGKTMPLKSYTLIHRDAIFTPEQLKLLTNWLEAERDKLAPPE